MTQAPAKRRANWGSPKKARPKKTLSTAELPAYVEKWEAKAAKSAGAGVPDEQIPH
jgi:hypothetical protein